MPYDNLISRSDADALIPEDVSNRLLTGMINQSAALTLFPRVPMSRAQQRMPVLSALPTAYFVNGDTGLKQTSEQAWTNKFLNVEELAVILPIPENVLDDTDFDIWGSVQPHAEQAIARAVDAAVFFGTNKPASWPDAIVPTAVALGNAVNRGANTAAEGGLAQDISDTFATAEGQGFDVNGIIATRSMRGRLRSVRNAQGDLMAEVSPGQAWGVDISYPMRGMWPTGDDAAELIAGDFTNGILGIRKDMTWKLLDQAVIQDNTGAIIYNLAQQDMVAMRLTFRCAWQVANVIRYDELDEELRYPWAVLRSPSNGG